MKTTTDPSLHQLREREMIQHVSQLLSDSRMVLDTSKGRRSVTTLQASAQKIDRSIDMKRLMSELNVPDRELQSRMPVGEILEVTLSRRRFLIFNQVIGRLRVVSLSPVRNLIRGESPTPMDASDVKKFLREQPPSLGGVPTTIVLVSTSGFTNDARECVDRGAEKTLILAEPNDAGGWSIYGPTETKGLNDLLNPEGDSRKRERLREFLDSMSSELLTSSLTADKIAARTELPLQWVENEVKSYAKDNPGLVAKRLDGRVMLYREGNAPLVPQAASSGDSAMPIFDRIKSLFTRKGETEKKISFLSERRAVLSLQRDRAYEELAALDHKDAELRKQFAESRTPHTKRRITAQLVQLRKDIERRNQMLQVFSQKINVVSTHLHNLELVQQGSDARIPDSEEIAADAAAAEETLAQLQADNELADTLTGPGPLALSAEEQALFEELEAEVTASQAPAKPEPAKTPEKARPAVHPVTEEPELPRQSTRDRSNKEAEPG
jgi:hypothetical protein